MKGKHHVFMDQSPGAAGGGAGAAAAAEGGTGGGAAGAGSGAGGSMGAAESGGGAAGAGAAGAGANGASGGGAAGSGSALAAGAGGAGAGEGAGAAGVATGSVWERVPEKFQVKKADGTLDQDATAAKVEEHRASLEKRMGEGGVRPKTAAEYKLPEPPEALKGMVMDEAVANKFRDDAHKAGFSQAQFDFALGEYYKMAPALVGAGKQLTREETISSLKSTWGDSYEKNGADAWRGMTQLAQASGLDVDAVEKEFGNSPAFNRIMAAVGAQMKEDTPPNPGGGNAGGGEAELATIQASPAYRNTRDPAHAAAVARYNSIVTKGVPDTPIA